MDLEKTNHHIFQSSQNLSIDEVLDKMSFVLADNATEQVLRIINQCPDLIFHNDYQLIKLTCWVGNMDLFDMLISYGCLSFFQTPSGEKELIELGIFSPRIKSHIINRINSKDLYIKLNADLPHHSCEKELVKV